MSVYMIADITVLDPDVYAEYVARVKAVVEAYGGHYVVRGAPIATLAGGWQPERIILVGFPSMEALHGWLGSPEYAELAPLREQSAASRAIVVQGWDE